MGASSLRLFLYGANRPGIFSAILVLCAFRPLMHRVGNVQERVGHMLLNSMRLIRDIGFIVMS